MVQGGMIVAGLVKGKVKEGDVLRAPLLQGLQVHMSDGFIPTIFERKHRL